MRQGCAGNNVAEPMVERRLGPKADRQFLAPRKLWRTLIPFDQRLRAEQESALPQY
jgi:hypothetical protein